MAPRIVKVAATQQTCSWDLKDNVAKAEKHVRDAAAQGANIILLQELFEMPYFCQEQVSDHFKLAALVEDNPLIERFAKLAGELGVVLPLSFLERANNVFYNSLVVIDADGTVASHYRKSHIPDGPGYQEKWYFTPGDTGFKPTRTKYGTIGTCVCWDQWFPEPARILALQGAELLFYPTAIGTEPQDASLNSYGQWCRVMMGHAGANLVPVIASNRCGKEDFPARAEKTESSIKFHGGSFITGYTGEVLKQLGKDTDDPYPALQPKDETGFIIAEFNLDEIAEARHSWGLFRDRRPELYGPLLTKDGHNRITAA